MTADQSIEARVRRKALKDAAKAMCGACAEGWQVKCGKEAKPYIWFHPSREKESGRLCDAGPIHALRENVR